VKILIVTNTLDHPLCSLAVQLAERGHSCLLGRMPGQDWRQEQLKHFSGGVDVSPATMDECDLVYVVVDSLAELDCFKGFDLAPYSAKGILDLARGSLVLRDQSERTARSLAAGWGLWTVVREERQLPGGEDSVYPGEVLVCGDYMAGDSLSSHAVADILWLIHKRLGGEVTDQPPSQYFEQLAWPPPEDRPSRLLAERLLEIDPFFGPAVLRRHLPALVRGGQFPEQLNHYLSQDRLWFASLLILEKHLGDDHPLRVQLKQLRRHCLPPHATSGQGKRILVFIPRKQRDLYIDLLLGYWLEEKGYEVFFRPLLDSPENSILELLPDVVIWGSRTTEYAMGLARFAKERNIISVARREETGYSREKWEMRSETEKRWWIGGWDYSPVVDLEFFSNQECLSFTLERGHLPKSRARAVGCMLMDPYFIPNLREKLPRREEFCGNHGIDPAKKNMLWATRWTKADRDPEGAVPEALFGKNKSGQAIPEIKRRVEQDIKCRLGWLRAIHELYQGIGDQWNFIVKVHPGEKAEAYLEFFAKNGLNIPVILDGYMVEILPQIDLLVHAGSNTALEAHSLGIPSVSYLNPDPAWTPIARVAPAVDTTEQLAQAIAGIQLGRSNADREMIAVLEKEFYGPIDGKATKRAAEHVDALLRGRVTRPFRMPGDRFVPGRRTNWDPYEQNATEQEIRTRLAIIRQCFGSSRAAGDIRVVTPPSFESRRPGLRQ